MAKFTWVFVFIWLPFLMVSKQEPIIINGQAQGTTYHIVYYDQKERNFKAEIEEILKAFDASLSTYIPTSIISKINTNQPNVQVDAYFITCFKKAKEIWKDTHGAFDPTVYPLVNAWGFGPGKKLNVKQTQIDSILKFVGFEKIELQGNKVLKKDPRVSLDFNAFAQGYSVDVVAQFLSSKGLSSFLVEIGGEVYARGQKPNGKYWTVGIEKPMDNKESQNPFKVVVKLKNRSLATSGNYRKFIVENGVKYAHSINPKTGYPSKNNLLSASVFAADCITSDATATAIMVMGLEKGIAYLKAHPNVQAYLT
ncbi:MAG: FAD:protein FMN transferase [Flavobacteriales bacterium]|nr:FAD:protein FMN transferase [Flavobacteriia bacterium]NCP06005.1 FAD:protein FMN transferase [Flavobacteriales bacterium]PIV92529.1 MAG: thiamine biosynthesis protein ApbE [Flavobacteriaceae bacterium CG17_big_fil_post_rev_8_21_14_2_50_33_15]PIY11234.1 MAG: thiamine biosynthesis protein ApbE [Flavobacteriaceae bacterium CG_4_10_14_3_um_filter_33_47]PJB20333.1 MAG: thiamine biosynthesis protein ApbE [Flavobacteriaceae bacterium CG_4_9_14_3_um_filter_33_16]